MEQTLYLLINWPEYQQYEDEDWFKDEAYYAAVPNPFNHEANLINACFIPVNRLNKK